MPKKKIEVEAPILEEKEIMVSGQRHKVVREVEGGYLCEDGCTYKV